MQWSGSLQWLETRAADPSPPTGPAYDGYTHGIGATIEGGFRSNARVGGWSGEAGLGVEGRGDRFGGDGVRDGASFSHAAFKANAALHRGTSAIWTLAPAFRLDVWTGQGTPELSARLDAGWQRGRTGITAAVGSAVTPPVLADLLFREGVGVKLNPDLRPERVRWEGEVGVRREMDRVTVSARFFLGRVQDMVVWAPDFRFIWSPRNFDVRRRGGEASIGLRPSATLHIDGTAAYSAVTYDIPDGAQVEYRPQGHLFARRAYGRRAAWSADVRWHRIGGALPQQCRDQSTAGILAPRHRIGSPSHRRVGSSASGQRPDRYPRRIHRRVSHARPHVHRHPQLSTPMIRLRVILTLACLALCSACADTNAPAPEPTEALLAVNSTANTLSIVPVDNPAAAVQVQLGGTTPTPVGVSALGRTAIVPLGLDNAVAVVDLIDARVTRTIPLPDNSGATGSAIVDDSIAFVANPNLNTVSRVNYQEGTTTEKGVGIYPEGIIYARGQSLRPERKPR